MKTFFRSVAMLLGLGLLPVAAHAQKKVIIEDKEPNSIRSSVGYKCRIEIYIFNDTSEVIFCRSAYVSSNTEGKLPFLICQQEAGSFGFVKAFKLRLLHDSNNLNPICLKG